MSARPKPSISMFIWRTVLWIVYAAIVIQLAAFTMLMIKDRSLSSFFTNHQSAVSIRLASHRLVGDPANAMEERLILFITIATGVALAVFLNLEISVSAAERNRLSVFKAKPVKTDEVDFAFMQQEHADLSMLLLQANIVSEDELRHVIELSKKTHCLIGDSIVAYGWLSTENLEKALRVQAKVRNGRMKFDLAARMLADARVPRELAHHSWQIQEEEEEEAERAQAAKKALAKAKAKETEARAAALKRAAMAEKAVTAQTEPTGRSQAAPHMEETASAPQAFATRRNADVTQDKLVALGLPQSNIDEDDLLKLKERVMSSEGHLRTGQPLTPIDDLPPQRTEQPLPPLVSNPLAGIDLVALSQQFQSTQQTTAQPNSAPTTGKAKVKFQGAQARSRKSKKLKKRR